MDGCACRRTGAEGTGQGARASKQGRDWLDWEGQGRSSVVRGVRWVDGARAASERTGGSRGERVRVAISGLCDDGGRQMNERWKGEDGRARRDAICAWGGGALQLFGLGWLEAVYRLQRRHAPPRARRNLDCKWKSPCLLLLFLSVTLHHTLLAARDLSESSRLALPRYCTVKLVAGEEKKKKKIDSKDCSMETCMELCKR